MESPYRRTNSRSSSPLKPMDHTRDRDRENFSDNEEEEDEQVIREASRPSKEHPRGRSQTTSTAGGRRGLSQTMPVRREEEGGGGGRGEGAAILKLDEDHHRSAAKTRPLSAGRTKLEPLPRQRGHHHEDDVKLPMYPFNPPAVQSEGAAAGGGGGGGSPATSEKKKAAAALDENGSSVLEMSDKGSAVRSSVSKERPRSSSKRRTKIRTDVNEKAKFLDPPTGKFRREFSLDHPLGKE